MRSVPGLSVLLIAAVGCAPGQSDALRTDSAVVAEREVRFSEALTNGETGPTKPLAERKPIARWVLPRLLGEISGLALTADGRLLVHDDESARIAEIDYRRGTIVKVFQVGTPTLRGDFEGITVGDESVFLLASNGVIYDFREGRDGERVDYHVHDTKLGSECEFEGIGFEASTHSLVLACKVAAGKGRARSLVLYRWNHEGDSTGRRASRLSVPLARVAGADRWNGLHPSDLAIDPDNGHLIMVTARQKALIDLSPDGAVARAEPLPGRHEHSEGVAITRDRVLIVSDEAGHRAASITLYRWR